MPSQHMSTPSPARIDALKAKHKSLSTKIEMEQRSPSISDYHIRDLKREKLKVKEEIEGIREAS